MTPNLKTSTTRQNKADSTNFLVLTLKHFDGKDFEHVMNDMLIWKYINYMERYPLHINIKIDHRTKNHFVELWLETFATSCEFITVMDI